MRLFLLLSHLQEELTKAKANGSKASDDATFEANTKNKQKLNYLSCIKQHIQDIREENQRLKVVSSTNSSPVSTPPKPKNAATTPTSAGKGRKF